MGKTRRIIYVISSVMMMLMIGAVYTYSVFRPHIEILFSLSTTLSGIPYMTSLFFYAISMMITGRLFKVRRITFILSSGLVLIASGWMISAVSSSFTLFTMGYGVLIGIGVGMVYGVPVKAMQILYPKKSGFFTGIILLGFGLSTLIIAPVSAYFIERLGISQTFLYFGLAYLIVLVPFILGMKLPQDIELNVSQDDTEKKEFPISLKRIYMYFVTATTIGLMMIGLSYTIGVKTYGFSVWHVAFSMSLFALMNGIARPLFGFFMDKKGFKWTALLSMSLWVIASVISIINQGTHLALFMVSYSLYWFNLGAWLSIIPATIKLKYPKEEYSKRYGDVFTGYGFGAIIGTLLSGFIMDLFGETFYLYLFIGVLAIFLIVELLRSKA
ncbi:MAG: hypothetical protein A2Y45_09215 [Tenericutes bacterium GWC2_34_14]|nr:MAG: hypothetical protein A2Z84_00100 [Tenericutes bacterium GWA2_35_7]OHE30064.1 MAG: hypothetical protein A2Y45_09215 [Tenericutes bacterium GWC2_34_14]OHE35044.1 MAG: hypothetical protein A2012_02825 [Tenericutes bacterium GWE2_34_108]OHE37096.1 MAG: hypothetical protein A2Y46_00185 [Tenericutes bacterium GWF1_35_14]OHE39772.1 MAG: hypothetical protein A2Y44_02675 [Tenericutes bacterium GWF2_35_184]OHE43974.1 MAG: hypothetical protein A3K26_07175 [Tenericutes bacterium RIFOXYA12_FULL_35_